MQQVSSRIVVLFCFSILLLWFSSLWG